MKKAIVCGLIGIMAMFGCIFARDPSAYAVGGLSDGTYTVSVSNDMPMGKNNISDTALLEKQNGVYYLSLTFNVAKLDDIRLEIDDKTVGSERRHGDVLLYAVGE